MSVVEHANNSSDLSVVVRPVRDELFMNIRDDGGLDLDSERVQLFSVLSDELMKKGGASYYNRLYILSRQLQESGYRMSPYVFFHLLVRSTPYRVENYDLEGDVFTRFALQSADEWGIQITPEEKRLLLQK